MRHGRAHSSIPRPTSCSLKTSSCCISSNGATFVSASVSGLRALRLSRPVPSSSSVSWVHPMQTTSDTVGVPHQRSQVNTIGGSAGIRYQGCGDARCDRSVWRSPLQAVAVAGDTPLVAVVFADTSDNASSPGSQSLNGRHVCVFDAASDVCLAELYFRGAVVHSLRTNRHLLVVVMADCFHIVDLRTLRHVRQQSFSNCSDYDNVLALSPSSSLASAGVNAHTKVAESSLQELPLTYFIAFSQSSRSKGDVCVLKASINSMASSSDGDSVPSSLQEMHFHRPLVVAAHEQPIAALSLSEDAPLLATASHRGSTVKLFDTEHGHLLVTYQRGLRPAGVYQIAMNAQGTMLAALSSNGTLHLFQCPSSSRPATGASPSLMGTTTPCHRERMYRNSIHRQRAFAKKRVIALAVHTSPLAGHSPPGGTAQRRPIHGSGSLWDGLQPVLASCSCYQVAFSADGSQVWVAESVPPRYSPSEEGSFAAAHQEGKRDRMIALLQRFAIYDDRDQAEEIYELTL